MNVSCCLSTPQPGFNSRLCRCISRDFSLTDHTLVQKENHLMTDPGKHRVKTQKVNLCTTPDTRGTCGVPTHSWQLPCHGVWKKRVWVDAVMPRTRCHARDWSSSGFSQNNLLHWTLIVSPSWGLDWSMVCLKHRLGYTSQGFRSGALHKRHRIERRTRYCHNAEIYFFLYTSARQIES